jgi:glycine cleavage system regulatory protein
MTRRHVVITLVGPDRKGIVAQLAKIVASCDGNWEESELARMADQFAGIILLTIAEENVSRLQSSLDSLADSELTIQVRLADDIEPEHDIRHAVTLTATDRVGIVQEVSAALRDANTNVDRLETEVEDAPHAGGRLFRARFEVTSANSGALDSLAEQLESIAADVMVDIDE